MARLASRSPAAPFQSSRPAPVIPSHQQAKDSQDEARREQQADEKIRELEEEIERLRGALNEALRTIRGRTYSVGEYEIYQPQIDVERVERWQNALDGGGDGDE